MTSKVEFFMKMSCEACVRSIKESLVGQTGVIHVDINISEGTVIVESTLSINAVKILLESTGRKAVLKGSATSLAAVAIIDGGNKNKIKGVIRFMQNDDNPDTCIIDGAVDDLQLLPHYLCIYEFGDVSKGCESVGSLYAPESLDGQRTSSTLGTFQPDKDGRAAFRITNVFNLSDVIGRSVVIVTGCKIREKVACGIIARSAGLFQNPKTICGCDGVSIWDETEKPI